MNHYVTHRGDDRRHVGRSHGEDWRSWGFQMDRTWPYFQVINNTSFKSTHSFTQLWTFNLVFKIASSRRPFCCCGKHVLLVFFTGPAEATPKDPDKRWVDLYFNAYAKGCYVWIWILEISLLHYIEGFYHAFAIAQLEGLFHRITISVH